MINLKKENKDHLNKAKIVESCDSVICEIPILAVAIKIRILHITELQSMLSLPCLCYFSQSLFFLPFSNYLVLSACYMYTIADVPITGNLPSTAIQPPSNSAVFPTRTANETRVTTSQGSTNLPGVTSNAYMSGSNQSLSAGGSTPSLSGTSEHASESVPASVNIGVRTMPSGSVPPGFVNQMVDPMSQQV